MSLRGCLDILKALVCYEFFIAFSLNDIQEIFLKDLFL